MSIQIHQKCLVEVVVFVEWKRKDISKDECWFQYLRVNIQLDWKITENSDIESWIIELIGKTSKNNQFLSISEEFEEVE